MTCVYTGAYVHFDDYNLYTPADLYEIGSCTIIRWVPGQEHYEPMITTTHIVSSSGMPISWFHRPDIGISAIQSQYVSGERR